MIEPMPVLNWTDTRAESIKVTLTTLDEYGLPIERRGITLKIPKPFEAKDVSVGVAEQVKATLYAVLGVNAGERETD